GGGVGGQTGGGAGAAARGGALGVGTEAVADPLARRITAAIEIPTIGIGGSVACDGQILVLEDMLGLSPRVPKFVKRYGELGPSIEAAVAPTRPTSAPAHSPARSMSIRSGASRSSLVPQ